MIINTDVLILHIYMCIKRASVGCDVQVLNYCHNYTFFHDVLGDYLKFLFIPVFHKTELIKTIHISIVVFHSTCLKEEKIKSITKYFIHCNLLFFFTNIKLIENTCIWKKLLQKIQFFFHSTCPKKKRPNPLHVLQWMRKNLNK